MARPTSLTPELQAKILELIRNGNYASVAAQACGIDPSTFRRWMSRGKTGEEPFCAFYTAVKTARAEAEAMLVDIVKTAAFDNWQAAMRMLEALSPRWARCEKVKQTVDDKRQPKAAPDEAVEAEVLKHIGERYGVDLNAALEEAKRANHN